MSYVPRVLGELRQVICGRVAWCGYLRHQSRSAPSSGSRQVVSTPRHERWLPPRVSTRVLNARTRSVHHHRRIARQESRRSKSESIFGWAECLVRASPCGQGPLTGGGLSPPMGEPPRATYDSQVYRSRASAASIAAALDVTPSLR